MANNKIDTLQIGETSYDITAKSAEKLSTPRNITIGNTSKEFDGSGDVEFSTDEIITGAASTIKDANLTANRALISNADGKVAVSGATSTELGYLSGTKGNVQTQFDRIVIRTKTEFYAGIGWRPLFEITDSANSSCIITIKRQYTNSNNEVHRLMILCTYQQCTIFDLGSKSNNKIIDKIRVVRIGTKAARIDMHYNSSTNNECCIVMEQILCLYTNHVEKWVETESHNVVPDDLASGETLEAEFTIPANNILYGTGNKPTAADIGALSPSNYTEYTNNGWRKSGSVTGAGWYRIAESKTGGNIGNNLGIFVVNGSASSYHSSAIFSAGTNHGGTGTIINQIAYSSYGDASPNITKARIIYHTKSTGNYAYVEIYVNTAVSTSITVDFMGFGWNSITPVAGSIPSGYTSKEITFEVGGAIAKKAEYPVIHLIANNTDLNNILEPGFYYISANSGAQTLSNVPTMYAFFMLVGQHAGRYQEITEYVTGAGVGTPKKYFRNLYGDTWGDWYRVYTEADPPSVMTGATTSAAGTKGLIPAPAAGENTKFLRGDGTWAEASGGGSVPAGLTSGYVRTGQRSGSTIGNYSTAEGYNTKSSAFASHAEGNSTYATEESAHAEGSGSDASGLNSHAEGKETTASGRWSHAGGYHTIASSSGQTAIGEYNVQYGNSAVATNSLFIVGNGNLSTRSNAFRVHNDGTPYAQKALQTSGADYAEYFEWLDENINNEDRRGYFVTLQQGKIRKANSSDDYILGVVSSCPVVIGNSDPDNWHGRFLRDEFGDFITQTITEQRSIGIDEETGNEIFEEVEVESKVLNPDFDESLDQDYIPRSERKEWSPIGMLGQLIVRDDGTCVPDSYCVVAEGGIATASELRYSGYRVVERINDNLVKIIFK